MIPISIIIIALSVWIFHLTSFWGTTIAGLMSGLFIIFKRKDLWKSAIISGLLVALLCFPVFWIAEIVSPGYIDKYWLNSYLSGIKIIAAPIEDVIFYFIVGFVGGPFYKFWKGYKITA